MPCLQTISMATFAENKFKAGKSELVNDYNLKSILWIFVCVHKVEFDICIKVQVLLHCSTYNFNLRLSVSYGVLLDSSPSSLALLSPQKSRLVSSKEPTGLLEQQPRNHGTAPHRDLQTQPVRTNQPPY